VVALGFEHGRNNLSNGFLIVHDENIFHLHGVCPQKALYVTAHPNGDGLA
jgi:hypothetical protein